MILKTQKLVKEDLHFFQQVKLKEKRYPKKVCKIVVKGVACRKQEVLSSDPRIPFSKAITL